MKRIITVFWVVCLNTLFATAQSTYVNNGNSANYTFAAGDSLYIASGTYTGTINCWVANTKITVAAGASFQPAAINGYRSRYIVNGTAILPNLNSGAGFQLYNYGTVTFTGSAAVNSEASIYNYHDASLSFAGNFAINSSSYFQNNGQVNISGSFNVNSSSTIHNTMAISMGGNFSISNGQVTNSGLFFAAGSITFSGNTVFTNTCRTISQQGITFYNPTVYNSGLIWASNATNNSSFTNHATITNSGNGVIKTVAFTNYGHIRGNGNMYITGASTLGGGASVGINTTTSDQLRIYTVNRVSTARIFDNQWGTVHASAFYAIIAAPDTLTPSNYGCSLEYAPHIILPVQWNSFSVVLSENTPVLNWSLQSDEVTTFEIERSLNGKDFTYLTTVEDQNSFKDFFTPEATTVYYRIKALTPDGAQKYSDVKTVRLTGARTAAAYRMFPNPFLQHFSIAYTAPGKSSVSVIVTATTGHILYHKKHAVVSGNNQLEIREGGSWNKGIYFVQIIDESGKGHSSIITKQ
ncbi:MAG: T9SS type A sorting domain-containing protein [Chitinophagaceae bacterium]|nr:T9SS type A sorting domain-containing protein [Chitinophagaceae bacterium]MCW5925972.1 T9SS type A sorting domain-containing protein [Chitinophagaceae bacterium]